jgi:hypothetical protein
LNIRKVITNPSGAFFVTLPIEYCRKHNLNGDCYMMATEGIDGRLELTPVTPTRQDQQVTRAATHPGGCAYAK